MRSAVWFLVLCSVAFFFACLPACLPTCIHVDCDVSSICDVSQVAFLGVLILFFFFYQNSSKMKERTKERIFKLGSSE